MNDIKISSEYDINFYLEKDFIINKNIYTKINSFHVNYCFLRKLFTHKNPSTDDNSIFCIKIDDKIILQSFINLSGIISFAKCGAPIGKYNNKTNGLYFIFISYYNCYNHCVEAHYQFI